MGNSREGALLGSSRAFPGIRGVKSLPGAPWGGGFQERWGGFCSFGELCYQGREEESRGGRTWGQRPAETGKKSWKFVCRAPRPQPQPHSTCPGSSPPGGGAGWTTHRGSAPGGACQGPFAPRMDFDPHPFPPSHSSPQKIPGAAGKYLSQTPAQEAARRDRATGTRNPRGGAQGRSFEMSTGGSRA